MLEIFTARKPVAFNAAPHAGGQVRYFAVSKYCSDFAIFEYIEEGGRTFKRKVADDIEHKEEAEIMAAALTAIAKAKGTP